MGSFGWFKEFPKVLFWKFATISCQCSLSASPEKIGFAKFSGSIERDQWHEMG